MPESRTIDSHARPEGYHPPHSVEELLARYAKGERYFAETDLPDGATLERAKLADANLSASWLFDADLREADLRDVDFSNTNVKCADFRGADLRGACFRGASIESANFERAVLTGATFAGAHAYGYTLTERDTVRPEPDGRSPGNGEAAV